MSDFAPEPDAASPRVFATTRWSVVLSAGELDSPPARRALETLCQAYWHPLFAYVRRNGYSLAEAQDLTQEYFADLIGREQLRLADPNRGTFRGFLLSRLDYFLAREWRRDHRQKRGGHLTFISVDAPRLAEGPFVEPADPGTPETHFLRHWALTVLKQAMDALQRECEAHGKGPLFLEAQRLIAGEREEIAYAEISRRLAMSEGAFRVAVHRLRQRYGELLRQEVAETVASEAEVDEELRFLLQVLSR